MASAWQEIVRQPHEQLEDEFGHWAGVDYHNVVTCSSGTAALHLALESLGLPAGSQAAIPNFTMVSCARAAVLAGMVPLFVDCDDRLTITEHTLRRAVQSGVRVIMAVHIYGRRCPMDEIHRFAAQRGIMVVEDMAEAHGVAPHPDSVAACWSFYKNKIIAGEEGGCISFRFPEHASIARQLRCVGFTDAHDFYHIPRGHNYRLADLLAEPIRVSLAAADENIAKRAQVERWYTERIPPKWRMPPRDVCWVYDVRIPDIDYAEQERIVRSLNGIGIAARCAFKPMLRQCEFGSVEEGYDQRRWLADKVAREVIYLPVRPTMRLEDVNDAADAFLEIART